MGSSLHGQRGDDLVITVPVGTVVRETDAPSQTDTGEETSSSYGAQVGADMETHISNSRDDRSALIAERGFKGEIRYLELEFKSLADCGMVGLPNAGKSTFLGAVSNAHPKIAPYPFTTINPYLGTIDYPDLFQVTLADIPGLIPGAHLNRGLGHSFLRHIERSKALVYIIDISLPTPHLDFQALKLELELYKPGLSQKPSLIIANKADLPTVGPHTLHQFKSLLPPGVKVVPVSAKLAKNVLSATLAMRRLVESSL
ncbi:GTPase of the mitochondrial inner membrane that associates with the large ribosomal subunit [Massospora cicadina]|nr:GTPase of the mitochondrial inner membrane that associates with the large ribosomal subunit [Massospora cicadina]